MDSFSQRYGYTPVRVNIQKERIDSELLNVIWNTVYEYYLEGSSEYWRELPDSKFFLFRCIWTDVFRETLDKAPVKTNSFIQRVKTYFFESEWYNVYNLIEFFPENYYGDDDEDYNYDEHNNSFINEMNNVLAKYLSAYRFVDNQIVEITSQDEIDSIETAINDSSIYAPVQTHLMQALRLFSDLSAPDYRNSIKESVSAIEALSKIITDNPKATLGQAIKIIEEKHSLHTAFTSALTKLYGYTSDEHGIRHSLLAESDLRQEDARFMLVICSAFVNYLISKID